MSTAFDQGRRRDPDGHASGVPLVVDRTTTVRFLALITLALAQTFDLATFQWMVGRHGLRAELNPIVKDLFDAFGMVAVVSAKVALVVLVAALFVAAWSRGRSYTWAIAGGLPIALAIAAGLIGGITNAATILR